MSSTGVKKSAAPVAGYYTNAAPVQTVSHNFGDWKITICKAPILSSQCTCHVPSPVIGAAEFKHEHNGNSIPAIGPAQTCSFCRNQSKLTLEHLPDMVFADNLLRIENTKLECGIEFNAIDAVNSIKDSTLEKLQVASASVWQDARAETFKTHGNNRVNYDWTFTPDYRGTLIGQRGFSVEPTSDQLDMEMLSRKDPVLLFENLQLFGDELDDNGCAEMDVKIRVVDLYVFVLLRFYLRVDHVVVRLHDTRLLFEKGKDYMLREFSTRESEISKLPAELSAMEPMQIWSHLPANKVEIEKLRFRT